MKETSYIDIAGLPDEEKKKVADLDKKSEEIYSERAELFQKWNKVKRYLKRIVSEKTVAGKKKNADHALNLKELITTDEDHWEQYIDLAKIKEDLGDSKNIKAEVEAEKEDVLMDLQEIALLRKKILGKDSEKEPTFTKEVRDFFDFRSREYRQAVRKIRQYDLDLESLRSLIKKARESGEISRVHRRIEKYKKLQKQYDEFVHGSPEAFLAVAYSKIINLRSSFDEKGRIVETPYVRMMEKRIMESLKGNRSVFLHGELGSGKSEIAKHLSRKELSNEYLERWEKGDKSLDLKAHPKPVRAKFKDRKEYQKAIDEWQKERDLAREPYVISGHKGIDPDIFLGGIKIERIQKMTPEEQLDFKNQKFEDYRKKYPDLPEDKMEEDLKNYGRAIDEFLKSPVETKGYLGMFYKAMQEGRPIIIDEINAIPHHVLIMLNDLLTKGPGDLVKPMVDELPPFKVKAGYHFIATGNWKPENGLYIGREKIDAAFLSRLDLISIDYLPNATEFSPMITAETEETKQAQRELRQQNELFQMLLVRLMDKKGGINIPEAGKVINQDGKEVEYMAGWKQVYNLSTSARILQNVFSGIEVDKAFFPNFTSAETNPSEMLKENVLSLRHLVPILEDWKNDGFTRPLDDYIFKNYIERSKERKEEMKYIYQILQKQGGFFDPDKGWPDSSTDEGRNELLKFSINQKMYGVDTLSEHVKYKALADENNPKTKYMSAIESIRLLFGELPERKRIANLAEEIPEDEMDPVMRGQIEEALADIAKLETGVKEYDDEKVIEDEAPEDKKTEKKGKK